MHYHQCMVIKESSRENSNYEDSTYTDIHLCIAVPNFLQLYSQHLARSFYISVQVLLIYLLKKEVVVKILNFKEFRKKLVIKKLIKYQTVVYNLLSHISLVVHESQVVCTLKTFYIK